MTSFKLKWYYCSKSCQVSDWPGHKLRHKVLDKIKCQCPEISGKKVDFKAIDGFFNILFEGDLTEATRRIVAGESVMAVDEQGFTALHQAAYFGSTKCVEFLIKHATPELLTKQLPTGQDCLDLACQKGNLEVVQLLLREMNQSMLRNHWSSLYLASLQGHIDIVRCLIKAAGKELLYVRMDQKRGWNRDLFSDAPTCLDGAVHQGHRRLVKYLLEMGGKRLLFQANNRGYTSLHVACVEGNVELVKMLITAGGEELYLKRSNTENNCLDVACMLGHVDVVKALLDSGGGALLRASGKDGLTCLHKACQAGKLEVIKFLLGAHREHLLFANDSDGGTCMHSAAEAGQLEVVKYLAGVGGKRLLLALDRMQCSCLHTAVYFDRADVACYLAELCTYVSVDLSWISLSHPAGRRGSQSPPRPGGL